MRMISRQRWLAALVTLAYAWGYLILFNHSVTEQHAECVEHGAQHHVVEADRHDDIPTEGISDLGDIEDDHCELAELIRTAASFTPAAQTFVLAEQTSPLEVEAVETSRDTVHRAVWRYAPKTSPPALHV